MNFKKIVAAIAAAAVAVTMTAVSAFAATVELDAEYPGSWQAGKCIPKADLVAIGGDVKVTLTIETQKPLIEDQFLVAPMDYDNSWTRITAKLTSDTMVAKADEFGVVKDGETTVEFVVPADVVNSLGDSGIGFQVQNVIVKSAEIEAGTAQGAVTIIDEANVIDYCNGRFELGGAAEAPAADAAPEASTEAPATGNAPVAAIAVVMALAGAAAVASKKN